jgi:hypothetical protein
MFRVVLYEYTCTVGSTYNKTATFKDTIKMESQCSSVGLVTGWTTGVRFPARAK